MMIMSIVTTSLLLLIDPRDLRHEESIGRAMGPLWWGYPSLSLFFGRARDDRGFDVI